MTTATYQTLIQMMDDREATLESYIYNYLMKNSTSKQSLRLMSSLDELVTDYKNFKAKGDKNTSVDIQIMTNRFDNLYAMYLALV